MKREKKRRKKQGMGTVNMSGRFPGHTFRLRMVGDKKKGAKKIVARGGHAGRIELTFHGGGSGSGRQQVAEERLIKFIKTRRASPVIRGRNQRVRVRRRTEAKVGMVAPVFVYYKFN